MFTNSKNTKRALISSTIALIVCISMLIGSTYAWFTDSVSSSNNIIKSGNLDIELKYSTDLTNWNDVTEGTNIFMENTLWEPGHTEVVYLSVKNIGSLDLKYQLGINIVSETGSINKAGNPFKLSQFIDFGVKDPAPDTKYATAADAISAVKDSAKKISEGFTKANTLKANTNAEVLALVVYMPTTVNNDANYKTGEAIPQINLGLNLMATQLASESDSFGSDYDALATYAESWDGTTNPDELDQNTDTANKIITIETPAQLAALSTNVSNGNSYNGYTVQLAANIDLMNLSWTPIGVHGDGKRFDGEFDGQGYTIYNLKVSQSAPAYQGAGLFGATGANANIHDFKIVGADINNTDESGNTDNGAAVVVGAAPSGTIINNVDVENATVTANRRVGGIAGYFAGTITNCDVYNLTLKGNFDLLSNGEYDNCDKLGGIVAYVNTPTEGNVVSNNTVTDVTITGYRDMGGIAGYASYIGTMKDNKVKNLTIMIDSSHNYNNYSNLDAYDAGAIAGECSRTIDDSNTAENAHVTKLISDGFATDAEGNYYVHNATALQALNDILDTSPSHNYNINGKDIYICADIDATNVVWNQVWAETNSGNSGAIGLYGNGHTISNLTINGSMFVGNANGANISEAAIVKDITFDKATVTGGYHTGVIWGQMYGDVEFDNVHITNSYIKGSCNVGALIGRNGADGVVSSIKFNNCSSIGNNIVSTGDAAAGYDPNGASAFLGSKLEIENGATTTLTFTGNNIAKDNTFTQGNGQVGGNVYASWTIKADNTYETGTYGFPN